MNPTSDPDFLQASPDDQMKYLSSVDPDFAAASPKDKMAYLLHLRGSQPVSVPLGIGQAPRTLQPAGPPPVSVPMDIGGAPRELQPAGTTPPKPSLIDLARQSMAGSPLALQRPGVLQQSQLGFAGAREEINRLASEGKLPMQNVTQPLGTAMTGAAADVVGLIGQPFESLKNAGITAAAATPYARAAISPYLIYQGLKAMATGQQQGETTPDYAQRVLLGGAMASGAGAQTAASAPRLPGVLNKAATEIVRPTVKTPLGVAQENLRFGRDPASAIANEGIVGTKEGMIPKVEARTSELSQALDKQLSNHPNANVIINAEPVIDNAIDNAVSAANKVGNQAMVTRLENLRGALKTQYGRLQGTPLQINQLKQSIGDAAHDLGAFKGTDPVEASVARAMADVYTGLKNSVNAQVPEAMPLNERIADLMSARLALKRAQALNLSGSSDPFTGFQALQRLIRSTATSAPVRTGVARGLNIGQTYKKP